jgi:hypothetical protein
VSSSAPAQQTFEQSPWSSGYIPRENGHPTNTSPTSVVPVLDVIAKRLVDSNEIDPELSQTTYVGKTSSANFFRALSSLCEEKLLPPNISIESAFGLTNRTPLHPFGSLWTTGKRTIAQATSQINMLTLLVLCSTREAYRHPPNSCSTSRLYEVSRMSLSNSDSKSDL